MTKITIEHNPSAAKLEVMGVEEWSIWTKEVSKFPWTYESTETCYILEGKVTVIPDGGEPVKICPGDLVNFPAGMSCTWQVHSPIKKYYKFG